MYVFMCYVLMCFVLGFSVSGVNIVVLPGGFLDILYSV